MAYETRAGPDAALSALADPTRRGLIEQLRSGPAPVAALAAGLPISRPAVSQHLKVLNDAGLVVAEAKGARRYYRLAPEGAAPLLAWLDAMWDDALSSFQTLAEQEAAR
ncbi:MAG: metalloregulator ArsR/SmtB family transcription factor [Pseudomonadota bacterium]